MLTQLLWDPPRRSRFSSRQEYHFSVIKSASHGSVHAEVPTQPSGLWQQGEYHTGIIHIPSPPSPVRSGISPSSSRTSTSHFCTSTRKPRAAGAACRAAAEGVSFRGAVSDAQQTLVSLLPVVVLAEAARREQSMEYR